MELIRLDSSPHPKPDEVPNDLRRSEYGVEVIDEYSDPESAVLRVSFGRFGRGEERRPRFSVEVNWIDVKGFLGEYMKLGHPEATYFARLIKLAEAVERAGWPPNDPPPAELSEYFPPQ